MDEPAEPYDVEHLEPIQFNEAAAVLSRAMQDDPVTASILPRILPAKRVPKLEAMFAQTLLTGFCHGNQPIGVIEKGKVRGAAVLYRPGTHPLPIRAEIGLLWRTILKVGPRGLGRYVRWYIRVGCRRPKTPYFYLETLGVEPSVQGQGLGSAMLRKIAVLVDAAGVECILETANPENVVLYRRFGFEVFDEEVILNVRVQFMVRRPAARADVTE